MAIVAVGDADGYQLLNHAGDATGRGGEAGLVQVQRQESKPMTACCRRLDGPSTRWGLAAAAVLPTRQKVVELYLKVAQGGDLLVDFSSLGSNRGLEGTAGAHT